MKRTLLLLLALLPAAAGCARDAPTEPHLESGSEPLFVKAPPEVVAGFVEVLDDLTQRLLPSLTDQAIAVPLNAHLRQLAAAMTTRDADKAREALTHARQALVQYQQAHGAAAPDAADLDGVGLNLLTAEELIGTDD